MNICIYEDEDYKNFFPFIYLNPVFDLRCGIFTFRERIEKLYPEIKVLPLSRFSPTPELSNSPTLFINGRAILKDKIPVEGRDEVFISRDEIVGFRVESGEFRVKGTIKKEFLDKVKNKAKQTEVNVEVIKHIWELISKNKDMIIEDYSKLKIQNPKSKIQNLQGNIKNLYIGKNVRIDPGVFLNAEEGPIYIGDNVHIRPPTIIDGPCYIGDNSLIDGAKIREGTSIGKVCKIAGEVEESVFLDYANKHHDGFVGHSYIGTWVNLGAGTTTSDLKNNYSTIRIPNIQLSNEINNEINTGLTKLGAFIGDHTKTGIGTLLKTGSIIGIFCNIYDGGSFPKYIPSFSWGTKDKLIVHKLEKAIETARICMARRNVTLSSDYIEMIKESFKKEVRL